MKNKLMKEIKFKITDKALSMIKSDLITYHMVGNPHVSYTFVMAKIIKAIEDKKEDITIENK